MNRVDPPSRMAVEWLESDYLPRVDCLAAPFSATDRLLVPEHPEWFRIGDVVRVGDERLEGTGEFDVFGNEIMRSLCEAVSVAAVQKEGLLVCRAWGVEHAQAVAAGERLFILGGS